MAQVGNSPYPDNHDEVTDRDSIIGVLAVEDSPHQQTLVCRSLRAYFPTRKRANSQPCSFANHFNRGFDGELDEVAVYARALPAT